MEDQLQLKKNFVGRRTLYERWSLMKDPVYGRQHKKTIPYKAQFNYDEIWQTNYNIKYNI